MSQAETPPFRFEDLPEYLPSDRRSLDEIEREKLRALEAPVLDHAVGAGPEMPSFPALAMRILTLAEDPKTEVLDLVTAIGKDPVVSARVIRLANSVFYSRGREAQTLRDAVIRLGMREVAKVAIAAASRSLFDPHERLGQVRFGKMWDRLWRHAMVVGFAASDVARDRGADAEQVFLGGMLHDIGKVLALRSLGSLAVGGAVPFAVSEPLAAALVEAVHVPLGAELAARWKLPSYVVEVCRDHHLVDVPVTAERLPLHAVRVVSGLEAIRTEPGHRDDLQEAVTASAAALGFEVDGLSVVVERLRYYGERAATL